VRNGHAFSGLRRARAAGICALVLASCGDGVGRPIVQEARSDDAGGSDTGLEGSGGEATTTGGDATAEGGAEAYCAAVEAWPIADAEIEERVVALLNDLRFLGFACAQSDFGESLSVLTHEPALRCAARVHTRDMIERGYFDHISPEGDGPADRIARAGYPLGVWAEVIGELDLAAGTDPFRDIVSEESEDCENLLDPRFDAVGVGYYDGVWTVVLAGPLQLSP
jgi:uncharacterized protein YkwD